MMQKFIILTVFLFLSGSTLLQAQESKSREWDNSANLLFGLNQPLLGGFNFEVNVLYNRLSADFSHGVSLEFDNEILTGAEKEQGLSVHIPYTTGFGVGYRFNNWLNLRVEPKWHRFDINYDMKELQNSSPIVSYTTFTLGLGAYANIKPFKNKDNFLKGFMIAPSIRWWPQLYSSLDNDQFTYNNQFTGQEEVHESMEVGINNTPWIFNISLGYAFKL